MMNKKKLKEDYNLMAVLDKLSSVMVEEHLVNKQKSLIFLKYKTYSELFSQEKEKNLKLEEENSNLYQQLLEVDEKKCCDRKSSQLKESSEKENLNNINSDFKVDLNKLEFDYAENHAESEENALTHKLTKLKEEISEKDRRIIELENKVIKLQILRRSESNSQRVEHDPTEDSASKDELLSLKAKLEYQRVEGERDKRDLNAKLREYMIKYEETNRKYNQCYEQLGASLINLEDLRKFHMSRDIKKTRTSSLLNSQIKGFEFLIRDLENKVNCLNLTYLELLEYTTFVENKNKELHERIKGYKLLSERVKGKEIPEVSTKELEGEDLSRKKMTGDDFYEQEISNLLEVCDSLTEENKKLAFETDTLQAQLDAFKRKEQFINKEVEQHKLSKSGVADDIQKYLQSINELTEIIKENSRKLEMSNSERNKLTKLNVERITCIEKYKEDLRNKTIENSILEKKYGETLKRLEDYNRRFEERLRADRPQKDGSFVLCNLCDTNNKNVALVSCMHTFCDECINTRIKFRNRRCPTCGKPFGSNDVRKVYI